MNKNPPLHVLPHEAYKECCSLIDGLSCRDVTKQQLKSVARQTQCPPSLTALKQALKLALNLDLVEIQKSGIISEQIKGVAICAPKKTKTKYPVFSALQQVDRTSVIPSHLRKLVGRLYVQMFSIENVQPGNLDPSIYYVDAYYSRDILIKYFSLFVFERQNIRNLKTFGDAFIQQCPKLIDACEENEQLKRSKLDRFYEILTGSRMPGERQKVRVSRQPSDEEPATETLPSDAGSPDIPELKVAYPTENSDAPQTISRSSPKRGSQLSRSDDRRALRGRLNNQAARNIVSMTDMHRLPLPYIVRFLSSLDKHPEGIVLGWLSLTTGMVPDHLLGLKIDSASGKEKLNVSMEGNTGILHYPVNNRPDAKRSQFMQLQLNPLVGRAVRSFRRTSPFSAFEETLQSMINNYSAHVPGQSPTLERISASSALHFSPGYLNEFEAAHLSGDIPAKLRAQVHYYPVSLAELNRKWQLAHQRLAERILNMQSCRGRFRSFLENLERFPGKLPKGTIGSVHSKPVKSLQHMVSAIDEKAMQLKNEINIAMSFEKLPIIADFIQIQHLQLYVIEQLSFGSRKFGSKTQYALASSPAMGWGSEKASAVFSVERKTLPLSKILQSQIEACERGWNILIKAAEDRGFAIDGKFHKCSAPLPAVVTVDSAKRHIHVEKLSSSLFSSMLAEYGLPALPPTTSKRVHLFKHIVAGELVQKVPQVLLDELLSHDRDALDFSTPWSTGSTTALDQLSQAIQTMLSELNIHPIALEGSDV